MHIIPRILIYVGSRYLFCSSPNFISVYSDLGRFQSPSVFACGFEAVLVHRVLSPGGVETGVGGRCGGLRRTGDGVLVNLLPHLGVRGVVLNKDAGEEGDEDQGAREAAHVSEENV